MFSEGCNPKGVNGAHYTTTEHTSVRVSAFAGRGILCCGVDVCRRDPVIVRSLPLFYVFASETSGKWRMIFDTPRVLCAMLTEWHRFALEWLLDEVTTEKEEPTLIGRRNDGPTLVESLLTLFFGTLEVSNL